MPSVHAAMVRRRRHAHDVVPAEHRAVRQRGDPLAYRALDERPARRQGGHADLGTAQLAAAHVPADVLQQVAGVRAVGDQPRGEPGQQRLEDRPAGGQEPVHVVPVAYAAPVRPDGRAARHARRQ